MAERWKNETFYDVILNGQLVKKRTTYAGARKIMRDYANKLNIYGEINKVTIVNLNTAECYDN